MEIGDAARKEQAKTSEDSNWRLKHAELAMGIQERYDAGHPLFTKTQLTSLAGQIANKAPIVEIMGMDGRMTREPASWELFENYQPIIDYKSIQRLVTQPAPDSPGEPSRPACSIDIAYTSTVTSQSQIATALGKMCAKFEEHEKAWETSAQCQKLKGTLSSAPIPQEVDKIICFGLGDPVNDYAGDNEEFRLSYERSEARSYVQHAAALTMARVLEARTGRVIRCYSQDPAYTQATIEFLKSRGIMVLYDPQAFVNVDDSTLVFTVSPNVPVKQIVTELARPAVIIWNATKSAEHDRKDWELIKYSEGREVWLSPYGTDPDSARTRKMEEEEYTSCPFPEDPENFGAIEIHVRKAPDDMKVYVQRS